MRAIAAVAVLLLAILQLVGSVVTAVCAGYALFWLSPKALMLCLGALALTVGSGAISSRVLLPYVRSKSQF